MLLTFDLGNSRLKCALWQGASIIDARALDWEHAADLDAMLAELVADRTVDVVAILSVSGDSRLRHTTSSIVGSGLPQPMRLEATSRCSGVTHAYSDPSAHGADRWAAVIAAHHLYDGVVCVIDAGSAITVDVVDADGRHLGGCIAPGSALDAEKLLERFDVEPPVSGDSLLADNTREAVASGCAAFAVGGIGYIYKKIRVEIGQDMQVVLTGGDAGQLLEVLETERPVRLEPDLVMHGLRIFAEMN